METEIPLVEKFPQSQQMRQQHDYTHQDLTLKKQILIDERKYKKHPNPNTYETELTMAKGDGSQLMKWAINDVMLSEGGIPMFEMMK